MGQCTRRDFLNSSIAVVGAAGLSLARPGTVWSKIRGANDDVRIAIVGLRKKGKEHIEAFGKLAGVRIVALCDVDTQFLDFESQRFSRRNEKVTTYVDYRKLLDDKDIDAVIVVAPDHWHALMTVWACQSGKDVYVEKPASYSVWEGRKMIEAARKYERIVQVGSQDRSDVGLLAVAEHIRQGNLGGVKLLRAFSYNRRRSIGKVSGPQPTPAVACVAEWGRAWSRWTCGTTCCAGRPAPVRRAHQPSRSRHRTLARELPARFRRHGNGHQPRSGFPGRNG